MIALNPDGALEAELRSLANQTNRSRQAVCIGLIRLGLTHKPTDVAAAINAAARPLGRPMTLPVQPEGKPKTTMESLGWDKLAPKRHKRK